MWFGIASKKEVKKEFKKISDSFKVRDNKINELKKEIQNNSLKIATLEGSYLVLSQKSQVSVSKILNKSQGNFETKLIKRIRNNKKSLVMAEIVKLMGSMPVIEMFEKIVLERGLCSKASFYRYISSLKSQKLIETETKVRLK